MQIRRPLVAALAALSLSLNVSAQSSDEEAIRFTSVPDIFNWNINYPQPGWMETLDWFFSRLKEEGPDFSLNAGDIMDTAHLRQAQGWRATPSRQREATCLQFGALASLQLLRRRGR